MDAVQLGHSLVLAAPIRAFLRSDEQPDVDVTPAALHVSAFLQGGDAHFAEEVQAVGTGADANDGEVFGEGEGGEFRIGEGGGEGEIFAFVL